MMHEFKKLEREDPYRSINLTKEEDKLKEMLSLDIINKHFEENISDIEKSLNIINVIEEDPTITNDNIDNIYRSQILLLLSTLDFYIHEIIIYGMYKMYNKEWKRSKNYENKTITIEYLHKILATLSSKRDIDNLFIKSTLNSINKYTYMKYKQIRDRIVNLLELETEIFPKDNKNLEEEKKLNALCSRRNKIAHQSDRDNISKSKVSIEKDYVLESIAYIKTIRRQIDTAIKDKNEKSDIKNNEI